MIACDPQHEAERLSCLHGFGVLDTPPEAGCDRITALAARLFDVPIASISLLDANRQWLKSSYGPIGQEAPREHSFCAHSLLTRRPLLVRDAAVDPRFANNPFVLGAPGIRFYAGAPLRAPEGFILGSLCVIGHEPRAFSPEEMKTLEDLADIATHELTLRKTTAALHAEVEKCERIERAMLHEHRKLETLRGTLERRVHERTVDLTRANEALRTVETRYQRIANNTPGMVYQFRLGADGSFNFPFASEACLEICGVEVQQLLDHPEVIMQIIHEEDRHTLFPAILASAESMLAFRWTGRYVMPDGKVKWMQSDSRPERQANGDVLWDGIITEITLLKQTQLDLHAAKEEAERANAAKSEFLSRMSHELRTPLNAILGFGQVLQQQALSPLQGNCLEHISKAGWHLLGLINEVLDIARIESGNAELTVEPIDLHPLIREIMDLLQPLAAKRDVRMRLDAGEAAGWRVLADRQRLKQILLNLLGNAVKYNVEGGRVTVACAPAPGEQVRIAISDTGLGISPENQLRLFTPFDRLGAEQRGIEGSGLGLSLCKRLVETLGGSIGVESRAGEGSTFSVQLPVDPDPFVPGPVETPARDEGAGWSPVGSQKVVLYVEDNPSNLQLIACLLQGQPNLSLLTAQTGAEGLAMAQDHRPDLILLDLHLPDVPGESILAELRADPLTRGIPIVVLSADATSETIGRLMTRGANAYLTKPLHLESLLQLLPKVLGEIPTVPCAP